LPRRRIVFLKDLAADLRQSVRRTPRSADDTDQQDSERELVRRLDETRERLRRETPPRVDQEDSASG
jgi:hypothetical protein